MKTYRDIMHPRFSERNPRRLVNSVLIELLFNDIEVLQYIPARGAEEKPLSQEMMRRPVCEKNSSSLVSLCSLPGSSPAKTVSS